MPELKTKKPLLVTGGAGYIASWVIKYLLEDGYSVRTTVRSKNDNSKIKHLLSLANEHPKKLEFFEADLLKENSFHDAINAEGGVEIVIHMASPFFIEGIKDPENELVKPALFGTKNVLNSVNKSNSVKRVVLTSSVASVMGDSIDAEKAPNKILDETYWNETSSLSHQPYPYSKVLAEKEAWKIHDSQNKWKLTTINPSFVLGPSLSERVDGTSVNFMRSMVNGKFVTGVPTLYMGVVDVRDVALAHIAAALNDKASGRHIVSAHVMSILEMATILKTHFPNKLLIPRLTLPKSLAYLLGPFFGLSWQYINKNIGISFGLDHSYSIKDLGISYRPISETLVEHIKQLEEVKLI
ncbi:MAG: aldehyde reductase [Leptospira sp.]|nr:aldehyde reductase [Leptospira sp.]